MVEHLSKQSLIKVTYVQGRTYEKINQEFLKKLQYFNKFKQLC